MFSGRKLGDFKSIEGSVGGDFGSISKRPTVKSKKTAVGDEDEPGSALDLRVSKIDQCNTLYEDEDVLSEPHGALPSAAGPAPTALEGRGWRMDERTRRSEPYRVPPLLTGTPSPPPPAAVSAKFNRLEYFQQRHSRKFQDDERRQYNSHHPGSPTPPTTTASPTSPAGSGVLWRGIPPEEARKNADEDGRDPRYLAEHLESPDPRLPNLIPSPASPESPRSPEEGGGGGGPPSNLPAPPHGNSAIANPTSPPPPDKGLFYGRSSPPPLTPNPRHSLFRSSLQSGTSKPRSYWRQHYTVTSASTAVTPATGDRNVGQTPSSVGAAPPPYNTKIKEEPPSSPTGNRQQQQFCGTPSPPPTGNPGSLPTLPFPPVQYGGLRQRPQGFPGSRDEDGDDHLVMQYPPASGIRKSLSPPRQAPPGAPQQQHQHAILQRRSLSPELPGHRNHSQQQQGPYGPRHPHPPPTPEEIFHRQQMLNNMPAPPLRDAREDELRRRLSHHHHHQQQQRAMYTGGGGGGGALGRGGAHLASSTQPRVPAINHGGPGFGPPPHPHPHLRQSGGGGNSFLQEVLRPQGPPPISAYHQRQLQHQQMMMRQQQHHEQQQHRQHLQQQQQQQQRQSSLERRLMAMEQHQQHSRPPPLHSPTLALDLDDDRWDDDEDDYFFAGEGGGRGGGGRGRGGRGSRGGSSSRRGRPRKHAVKIPLPPLYVFIRNLLHSRAYNPRVISW